MTGNSASSVMPDRVEHVVVGGAEPARRTRRTPPRPSARRCGCRAAATTRTSPTPANDQPTSSPSTAAAPRVGLVVARRARARRTPRPRPAAAAARPSSARRSDDWSQERLAVAAVGRDLVDDAVALQQQQRGEPLAQLPGLRVAQVHAIAGPQRARRARPVSGVCTSPAPSSAVSRSPAGGTASGAGRGRPGPDAGYPPPSTVATRVTGPPHDRDAEERRGPRPERAVVVEQPGPVTGRIPR